MDMVNVNGEHANELLEAQAHVWNHIFNFINSMSLKCAIDLGIPDIIHNHGKPMTVTELVAALPTLNPTKACNIYRLMRILVHSGFFAHQKLDDDAEEGTWFQNDDQTPFVTAHGKMLWDYCSHDPRLNNSFNEAMASDAQFVNSILIDKYNGGFEGMNSLVDVGGGTGTLGKAVADAFPHFECTVFDLPHVVAGLQGSNNLKYVGGDMFKSFPAADAVLLKSILHDWNDEKCLKILKRCKEAISSQDKVGGKVVIIDMVLTENEKVNDQAWTETQLFFELLMMVLVTGRERGEDEWAKLFSAAGFSNYKITPILGLRSLIEAYP